MQYYTECPICKGTKIKPFLEAKDYSITQEDFNICQCSTCGFKFTNPIPEIESIGQYYKSEAYISHTNSSNNPINFIYKIVRRVTLKQKRKLIEKSTNRTNGNLLDIGAGTGHFLSEMNKHHWKIEGIELDTKTRQLTQDTHGIKLKSNLNEIEEHFQFDAITMWHVLEHLHNLNETLQIATSKLKKEGCLIIAVPNPESYDAKTYGKYWAAYDLPRHLYHFNKSNITSLAKQHNLKVIKILPMKFDSYYVSLLSNKLKYGRSKPLSALLTGFQSNIKAKATNNYSSLIYILQHV